MNQQDYLKRFKEVTDLMLSITTAKNSDYSGVEDAFKNFKLIELLTGGKIQAEHGLLVRLTDKLQRVSNLLEHDAFVQDEKITDTLLDMANYAIILKIYLENK